ncbi:transposase [Chakrabartyella piscis]|uniref:transposase n=1 Tax=Chakrabartyella piscis TaxID=2918914 RepID=UPI0029584D65|nr:transposase [Chakrabartyella piscis]
MYFVTICTQDRKNLYWRVGDGFPIPRLSITGKIVKQYIKKITGKYPNVYVDKFVIMPNHIHMIVAIDDRMGDPSPTLGSVMGWFKYQTTKEMNLIFDTQGTKRWQRSYFEHVIRNEKTYLEIWQYIDTNPLKWELDEYYITEN